MCLFYRQSDERRHKDLIQTQNNIKFNLKRNALKSLALAQVVQMPGGGGGSVNTGCGAPTAATPPTPLKNVSPIANTDSPPEGCVWIYVHCSVNESVNVNGVYEYCGIEIRDVSLYSVEDLNNFNSIFGTVGSRSLAKNISGYRVGPRTHIRVFKNVGFSGDEITIDGLSEFKNMCSLNGWNDQPNSLKLWETVN